MKEGLIPAIIGTGVTALGITLNIKSRKRRHNMLSEVMPMVTSGLIGFGLAHVLLGTINLCD